MRPSIQVIDTLRSAIITGQLMPNERLVEVDLAERVGTTRAQIRSSLVALEGEGLVISEPNRGARVRRITPAEALEITEARAVLEELVAMKAAENAQPADLVKLDAVLARMRTAIEKEDPLTYSAHNGELHKEIRRISQHAVAMKLLSMLNSQVVRYQFSAILIPGRAAKSFAEHQALVEAIRSRDPKRAREAMGKHLAHVTKALRQAISAQEIATQLSHPQARMD